MSEGVVLEFYEVADNKVKILFLDPVCIGKGLGRKMLLFAVNVVNADKLEVNEQSGKAGAFYQKFVFMTCEWTETYDQVWNHHLLRMKLSRPF